MYNLEDKEIQNLMEKEYERQQNELEMIASENYVSKQVMKAYANVFTNKYSEGYPGRRYYGGQEYVDQMENLACERALRIFWLDEEDWHVNVQPLSWAPANLAVFLWLLNPWETILGMDLSSWGHLTHGHPLNASGVYYNIVSYWVRKEDGLIDYDDVLKKAIEYKPSLILAWFSAYPRKISWEKFANIADEVEKKHWYRPFLMADIAHVAWLIAGGVYSSPFPYFDVVTTTTHKTLRWPRGGLIYCKQDLKKQIDKWVFPWVQWWPHEHVIAAKAVAFGEVLNENFSGYARQVVDNAQTLAEWLKQRGWNVVTKGTDNHIVLLDITSNNGVDTNIGWKLAEQTLESIWISLNKNMLPFDTRKPMDPSGLRLWTSAVTTRGLWKTQMEELSDIIDMSLKNTDNLEVLEDMKKRVYEICKNYPIYNKNNK